MSKHNNKIVGDSGEKRAVKYLKGLGYGILEKNFKTETGEIDIIAYARGTIIFVEVKTRQNDEFGLPADAVNIHKQRKISMVAAQYIKKNNLYGVNARFDVIDILLDDNKITHYEDAFDSYLSY